MSILNTKFFNLVLFLTLFHFTAVGQDDAYIDFNGTTQFANNAKARMETIGGVKIVISKGSNDEKVQQLVSDKKGNFNFHLPYGTDYTVRFSFKGYADMYLSADASKATPKMYQYAAAGYYIDVILVETGATGAGKYKCPFAKIIFDGKKGFKEDPDYRAKFESGMITCADKQVALSEVKTEKKDTVKKIELQVSEVKKIIIAGSFMAGESPSRPVTNTLVYLVDAKNNIIAATTTNILGAFVFAYSSNDKPNVLKVLASDVIVTAGKKIGLISKDRKEISVTTADEKGGFKFAFLASDKNEFSLMEVEDAELKKDLIGKLLSNSKPLPNSKLNLIDNKGSLIKSVVTDASGKFIFSDINSKFEVIIALDESVKLTAGSKVTLTDEQGKMVQETTYDPAKGVPQFKLLPADETKMSHYYEDDPWLKVLDFKKGNSTVIAENIYFNANEYLLLTDAERTLDKVIDIMNKAPFITIELSAHTDSKGNDQYNMDLSQKRAKAAVDYMLSKKIDTKRLKGVGYGESKIINRCKNGIECTEEEHAKNRRIEFKISQ